MDSMVNFDQNFARRSFFGLPANLTEELFITIENFSGLDGEFFNQDFVFWFLSIEPLAPSGMLADKSLKKAVIWQGGNLPCIP